MRKIVCLIGMLVAFILSYGQNATVIRQVKNYYETSPETILLHTDQNLYFGGEIVWYKLYLTNAAQSAGELSVVAYVEITDAAGNVLVRNKLKLNNGLAFGNIVLPENIPSAVYVLSAYTLPMMKARSLLAFEKHLPVFNKNSVGKVLATESFLRESPRCPYKFVAMRDGDKAIVDLDPNTEGTLIIHSRGRILVNRNVADLNFPYAISNIGDEEFVAAIFSNDQQLSCESYVPRSNRSEFTMDVDYDALVNAGSRAALSITLRDSLGELAGGNFSVSIKRDSRQELLDEHFFDGTVSFSELQKLGDVKLLPTKEKYLYPKHSESLVSLKFVETFNDHKTGTGKHTFSLSQEEVTRQQLISQVDSLYGISPPDYNYLDTYLPFDNTYIPDEFQPLPTLEEFFTEIVKQGRIKRKRGKTTLILKNTENKSNVFNYNNNPLILVDGYIVNDVDAVLNLDPALIRKINLTWKTSTLTDAAIASLADNGILAIYSKSGSLTIGGKLGPGVYDGFHIPLDYKLINKQPSGDSERPEFTDLLYWNPAVEVRGKQKLAFQTSSDLGQYTIDIVGVTFTGEHIRKQLTFEVVFKK